MIPILTPFFPGPLAPLGEALALSPTAPPGALPVLRLINDAAVLKAALVAHARWLDYDGNDLRAVASAWSMAYLGALLPPYCVAASVLEHVFPAAAGQLSVSLDAHGTPSTFHLHSAGHVLPHGSAWERYRPLLQDHLPMLFAALTACSRIPPKILWGNVARHLHVIFDNATQQLPSVTRIETDRAQLLESADGDHGPNPLHDRQRCVRLVEDGRIASRVMYRQCCLYVLLPPGLYCQGCPLDPAQRSG